MILHQLGIYLPNVIYVMTSTYCDLQNYLASDEHD